MDATLPNGVDTKVWTVIEEEDVEEEGFILVPTGDKPTRYAAKGPAKLFSTMDEARSAIAMMVSRNIVQLGGLLVVPAKLSHHRKMSIAAQDVEDVPQSSLIVPG